MSKPSKANSRTADQSEQPVINREQKSIIRWLDKVRFKKKMFGGVSERDVWKKIGELNDMYNAAILAERARYDALLEKQCDECVRLDQSRFDTNCAGGQRE